MRFCKNCIFRKLCLKCNKNNEYKKNFVWQNVVFMHLGGEFEFEIFTHDLLIHCESVNVQI